ncbi:MAG: hypothetical protein Q9164_001206 [Protoblastenia rupestris]
MSDNQTVSVPSLILLGVLSALAVRYFFFTPTSQSPSGPRPRNSRQANPHDVEQIATMFPQIPRRDIMWDLQRSGGNSAATTERILGTGGLETVRISSPYIIDWSSACRTSADPSYKPPPTFQPVIPSATTASTASTSTFSSQSKIEHIDLIKRYNLSDKLSNPPSTPGEGSATQQQTWSQNKHERQTLLQRRREEMILNARRKMEEKERQRGHE